MATISSLINQEGRSLVWGMAEISGWASLAGAVPQGVPRALEGVNDGMAGVDAAAAWLKAGEAFDRWNGRRDWASFEALATQVADVVYNGALFGRWVHTAATGGGWKVGESIQYPAGIIHSALSVEQDVREIRRLQTVPGNEARLRLEGKVWDVVKCVMKGVVSILCLGSMALGMPLPSLMVQGLTTTWCVATLMNYHFDTAANGAAIEV